MIKKTILLLFTLFSFGGVFAQTISGNLSQLAKQEIKLEGFNGLKTYTIASTTVDDQGNFVLPYTKEDIGVGYLTSVDNKPLFIILSGEEVAIEGASLSQIETIKISKGQENKLFEQYAMEYPKRQQAESAWVYLEKLYTLDSLFSQQKVAMKAILHEKKRISVEDASFLAGLPQDSYVSWFLPVRKLVSSVATVAQYRTEEIPATFAALRGMDYTDIRLYKSGLFKEAIDNHIWLLENSGRSLDSVYIEMKISIDAMVKNLVKDNKILNEATGHLFNLLEQHSLFQGSEYLALKLLNEKGCTLDTDLAKKLESYRAMKVGTTAADITFSNPTKEFSSLRQVTSHYKLVVFGSSWCSTCVEEIPKLKNFYTDWQQKYDLEIVFISLDTEKDKYAAFTKDFPWINSCDYKKWESKAVQDYYVFATPTMFLLDANNTILVKAASAEHANAWLQSKGTKEN
jgi:thiol-disulfide isomerase/thioredoxin